jgi:hypothetical protein
MVRAAWIEKIMSKTNDTSNLATLEHHDTFADSELDAVTGGAAPKLSDAAFKGTHIPTSPSSCFDGEDHGQDQRTSKFATPEW